MTDAMVEKCEADQDQFRSRPGKITARQAIEAAAAELGEFEQAALSAEAPPEDTLTEPAAAHRDRQLRMAGQS